MPKTKKTKTPKPPPQKQPWEIETEKRNRKSEICQLLAAEIARNPRSLEDLDDRDLDSVVRVCASLNMLEAVRASYTKLAEEQVAQKLRDAKYKAEGAARRAKANETDWRTGKPKKPKARAAKATPNEAAAKRAGRAAAKRPYQAPKGGSTPTPHRADGKSLSSGIAKGNTDATEISLELESAALEIAELKGTVTAGGLLAAVIGSTRGQATGALSRLVTRSRLVQTGKGRGTKYTLANGAGGAKAKPQLELGEVDAP